MNGTLRGLLSGIGILLLGGCPRPTLMRYYGSGTSFKADAPGIEPPVLTVFATGVPASSAQTALANLSPGGQASLIAAVSKDTSAPAALLQALAEPIERPPSPHRFVDRTIIERRIVLSIENLSQEPADRIHRASIHLEASKAGTPSVLPVSFLGWNQFITRYETVHIGSMRSVRSAEFSAEIKGGPPQVGTVGAGAKIGAALEEAMVLQRRYVQAMGVLTPERATLIQQGAFGADLMGNVIVDLQLRVGDPSRPWSTDVFSFSNLFDKEGRPQPADRVKLERQTVQFPANACAPIMASAQLVATIRHVRGGQHTIMEGDDKAVYQTVTGQAQTFELVPKEALRFTVWWLQDEKMHPVHIGLNGGAAREVLQFDRFEAAEAFLKYLEMNPTPGKVRERTLWLGKDTPSALSPADVGRLVVWPQRLNWNDDRCRAERERMPQALGPAVHVLRAMPNQPTVLPRSADDATSPLSRLACEPTAPSRSAASTYHGRRDPRSVAVETRHQARRSAWPVTSTPHGEYLHRGTPPMSKARSSVSTTGSRSRPRRRPPGIYATRRKRRAGRGCSVSAPSCLRL
jgi:hypothetical protein